MLCWLRASCVEQLSVHAVHAALRTLERGEDGGGAGHGETHHARSAHALRLRGLLPATDAAGGGGGGTGEVAHASSQMNWK